VKNRTRYEFYAVTPEKQFYFLSLIFASPLNVEQLCGKSILFYNEINVHRP
jgi:hypothetical protein